MTTFGCSGFRQITKWIRTKDSIKAVSKRGGVVLFERGYGNSEIKVNTKELVLPMTDFKDVFDSSPKVVSCFKYFNGNGSGPRGQIDLDYDGSFAKWKDAIDRNEVRAPFYEEVFPNWVENRVNTVIINLGFNLQESMWDGFSTEDVLLYSMKKICHAVRRFSFENVIFNIGYEPSFVHRLIKDDEYIKTFNMLAAEVKSHGFKVCYGDTTFGKPELFQNKLPDESLIDYISCNYFLQPNEENRSVIIDTQQRLGVPLICAEFGLSTVKPNEDNFKRLRKFIDEENPEFVTYLSLKYSESLPGWSEHRIFKWEEDVKKAFKDTFGDLV